MAIEIPFIRPVTGKAGSVSLPLLPAVTGKLSRSAAERRLVAAVTGGVAICAPKKAVELARLDRERPEDVIAPDIDDDKLQVLFDAVDEVLEDADAAPELTDADRQAARRLRVDPRLVAAVRVAADDDADACEAGLAWTASLNARGLGTAARVGSSENELDRIPPPDERLDDLKARVDELTENQKVLQREVAELKKSVGRSPAARGRSGRKKAGKKTAKKAARKTAKKTAKKTTKTTS